MITDNAVSAITADIKEWIFLCVNVGILELQAVVW